tara:strand:- start:172 stop:651 length:480 start_codon:yes stop_codon:yes gene_type:complete
MPKQEEVEALVASAYQLNEQGKDQDALDVIERALSLQPDDVDLLEHKSVFLWNVTAYRSPQTCLDFGNDCLAREVGSELYFRVWRARVLDIMGCRYDDGTPEVTDVDKCLTGIADLQRALELEPNLFSKAEDWGWVPLSWEEDFGGLRLLPEFPSKLIR